MTISPTDAVEVHGDGVGASVGGDAHLVSRVQDSRVPLAVPGCDAGLVAVVHLLNRPTLTHHQAGRIQVPIRSAESAPLHMNLALGTNRCILERIS